jgi:hypothetical protein
VDWMHCDSGYGPVTDSGNIPRVLGYSLVIVDVCGGMRVRILFIELVFLVFFHSFISLFLLLSIFDLVIYFSVTSKVHTTTMLVLVWRNEKYSGRVALSGLKLIPRCMTIRQLI